MRPPCAPSEEAPHEGDLFLAEVCRLQGEVRQVGQQLERIEAEMHRALNDVARERFWEYR